MTCRTFFVLSLLVLAAASMPSLADSPEPASETPAADDEAVAAPLSAEGDAVAGGAVAASLLTIPEAVPQDGFMGCPYEDVFGVEAPPETVDCQQACADLCAQNGGTLLFGSTKTGADCTCACCRS